jgi:hypothetical protein
MGRELSTHGRHKTSIQICQKTCIKKTRRPQYRWKNLKIKLKETGHEDVDWIHLAHNKVQ